MWKPNMSHPKRIQDLVRFLEKGNCKHKYQEGLPERHPPRVEDGKYLEVGRGCAGSSPA